MSKTARMLGAYLPAMVLLALAGYIVLGAFPGALITGDFLATLGQLPLISAHAFAAIGVAWLFDRNTFADLDNATERALRDAAAAGQGWALGVLVLDFLRRFLPLCAFLVFFHLPR